MPETTLQSQRVFDGRLIQVEVLEVAAAGGRRARREIVRHPGAVAVWARAPDGRFVFVRQFRKAVEQPLLEIVAGTREPGEPAEACVRREIREETGYAVQTLAPLGLIVTAPGFCNERIDLFYAELAGRGAPQPDADECLDVVLLDAPGWRAMIARGAVSDAKSLAAWALVQARCGMKHVERGA